MYSPPCSISVFTKFSPIKPRTTTVIRAPAIKDGALKAREKSRLNGLQILRFDSKDVALIQLQYVTVKAFSTALGLNIHLSENQVQSALEQAHMASDGYYSLKHAEQWNTTFEFPQSAIDADTELWHRCSKDLATL